MSVGSPKRIYRSRSMKKVKQWRHKDNTVYVSHKGQKSGHRNLTTLGRYDQSKAGGDFHLGLTATVSTSAASFDICLQFVSLAGQIRHEGDVKYRLHKQAEVLSFYTNISSGQS